MFTGNQRQFGAPVSTSSTRGLGPLTPSLPPFQIKGSGVPEPAGDQTVEQGSAAPAAVPAGWS